MPLYDFKCAECDERFEMRRSFAEYDEPVTCPNGHEGAQRVITSWGTGGAIRSGTPTKVIGRGGGQAKSTIEADAKKIAQHKRHG